MPPSASTAPPRFRGLRLNIRTTPRLSPAAATTRRVNDGAPRSTGDHVTPRPSLWSVPAQTVVCACEFPLVSWGPTPLAVYRRGGSCTESGSRGGRAAKPGRAGEEDPRDGSGGAAGRRAWTRPPGGLCRGGPAHTGEHGRGRPRRVTADREAAPREAVDRESTERRVREANPEGVVAALPGRKRRVPPAPCPNRRFVLRREPGMVSGSPVRSLRVQVTRSSRPRYPPQ